jgi:hypothetical protein
MTDNYSRKPRNASPVVPTYVYDKARASVAYEAFVALLRAERDAELLGNLPSFTMAKLDVYEAFARAFERV